MTKKMDVKKNHSFKSKVPTSEQALKREVRKRIEVYHENKMLLEFN